MYIRQEYICDLSTEVQDMLLKARQSFSCFNKLNKHMIGMYFLEKSTNFRDTIIIRLVASYKNRLTQQVFRLKPFTCFKLPWP